jgi:hypothetical protein
VVSITGIVAAKLARCKSGPGDFHLLHQTIIGAVGISPGKGNSPLQLTSDYFSCPITYGRLNFNFTSNKTLHLRPEISNRLVGHH